MPGKSSHHTVRPGKERGIKAEEFTDYLNAQFKYRILILSFSFCLKYCLKPLFKNTGNVYKDSTILYNLCKASTNDRFHYQLI